MARGINKVILIGNLGRDPETRYSQGGSPITNFSLATSESWRDRQTGEQHDRTEWHNLVCFSRLAEIAGEYLRKGSKVYIEGRLQTSSWEQDGQKRYRTEIIVRDMQMLDSRADSGVHSARPPGPEQEGGRGAGASHVPSADAQGAGAPAGEEDFDDDIPF